MRVYISWKDNIGGFLNGERGFIVFRSVGTVEAHLDNVVCTVHPSNDSYPWTEKGWYVINLNSNVNGLRMESHNTLDAETVGETFEISYLESNLQSFLYSVAGIESDGANGFKITPLVTSNLLAVTNETYPTYHP